MLNGSDRLRHAQARDTGNSHFGRAVSPPIVMAGLVPAIPTRTVPRWMAGTSPAMTVG
jgi:hypothetical protein